jgi:hypothetical protein
MSNFHKKKDFHKNEGEKEIAPVEHEQTHKEDADVRKGKKAEDSSGTEKDYTRQKQNDSEEFESLRDQVKKLLNDVKELKELEKYVEVIGELQNHCVTTGDLLNETKARIKADSGLWHSLCKFAVGEDQCDQLFSSFTSNAECVGKSCYEHADI